MGRFNIDHYDVVADSSPGTGAIRKMDTVPDDALILVWRTGWCPCGCAEKPLGKKAVFAMGHDARLRGKLIRAELASRKVVIVATEDDIATGGEFKVQSPVSTYDVAKQFGHGNFSWIGAIRKAVQSQSGAVARKIERANREVLARATGPQQGERRLIKVGRWSYTGQVMAVYADGDNPAAEVDVEYVTKTGETKTVRLPVGDLEKADA